MDAEQIVEPPAIQEKKPLKVIDTLAAYRNEFKAPDASLCPSYTRLTIPYRVICRLRYQKAGGTHRKQFLEEHSRIELLQPRALDGVRIHKEFCQNLLAPIKKEAFIKLTEDEQYRLDFLMQNTIY